MKLTDEESCFVYTMDKILTEIGIVEIDNRTLGDCGISSSSFDKLGDKIKKYSWTYDMLFVEMKKRWSAIDGFFAAFDLIPEYKKHKKQLS